LPRLDVHGRAAPPRRNGELAFEHPWQSRLFATTMALCDIGTIEYEDFRRWLIAEIDRHPDQYWSSWQDALETLLQERALVDAGELARRAERFAQHPPRGTPT
jgi:hypothetical protein